MIAVPAGVHGVLRFHVAVMLFGAETGWHGVESVPMPGPVTDPEE